MPKRVAVIDLGSNSARMVIFERTSRLGFFIFREYKIKVRLGEGAYENGGVLQQKAMDNVFSAFSEFKHLIKFYGVKKVLCVGTSALRDAPNAKDFIKRIFEKLALNLRVIDGKTEAFFGGIAALNLLSPLQEATTLDIGGGSAELAKIQNGKIIDTISLNLGTVRLKELFSDKNKSNLAFINERISQIPEHFKSDDLIAIGGSLRAISDSIITKTNHPIKTLHNFSYKFDEQKDFINAIIASSVENLKDFYIKKDRFDTIREGASIFVSIADKLGIKSVFTSSAGVREGVFLSNLLRPGITLPKNFNPSIRSLQDRFCQKNSQIALKFANKLFKELSPLHKLSPNLMFELGVASRIFDTTISLNLEPKHGGYMIRNGINYGFTHNQKALIAAIIEYYDKGEVVFEAYGDLLPDVWAVKWLSYILLLSQNFGERSNLDFKFTQNRLEIYGVKDCFMLKDNVNKLIKPSEFEIVFA